MAILIVNEDRDVCRRWAQQCRRLGYSAYATGSGEEAMNYLRIVTPRLIILATATPGLAPLELLRRVRVNAQTANLPVVVRGAACGRPAFRQQALDAGASDCWVDETLDAAELKSRLERLVDAPPASSPPAPAPASDAAIEAAGKKRSRKR